MAWSEERGTSEADADALIRRGTLEQAGGNLEEAESLYRDALRALEHADAPREPALVGTLNALGQLLVDQGAFGEAESMLTRALELSETAPGAYDEELPILLLELSRVYILQSAYERAEKPLQRLLAITKARGEGRPEVATVLASLAAVRHARGDYTSAEALYREALSIRERTLSPNHITTAATLESLAETCAARGRFADAVSLCNRALSMREATLGASDASVRVVRKRIADLQLEAPEGSRLRTPPRSAPTQTQQSLPPVDEPVRERRPVLGATALPAVLIPWSDQLTAVRDEIEGTSSGIDANRARWRSALASAVGSLSYVSIAVAAGAVVVLAALGFKLAKPAPNTFADAEPFNPAARSATQAAAPAAAVAQITPPPPLDTVASASTKNVVGTVPPPVATGAPSPTVVVRPRPQAPPPSRPVVQQPQRASAIAPSASRADAAPASRVGNPPTTPVIDSTPTRTVAPAVEKPPETRARSEPVNSATSPTLIGTAPQPPYPEALRDQQVEGEVVVQFVVDENGRPDVSSMTVVRSPHVLLTNAVRAVLPQFRFDPARTAPPQSTPRPETVRYAFTFRAPRR